jgi:NAD(P)-dependent dehydrogenase (short-subunit alcohol dehydrogenase family)
LICLSALGEQVVPYLDSFSLAGRVALVTGATEGVGQHIALGLAEAGADLILCGQRRQALDSVAAKIAGFSRQVEVCTGDLTDLNEIDRLKAFVQQRIGRLDILVNSAGFTVTKPAWEMSETDWDRMLDIGFKGLFFCCQIFGSIMRQQHYGKIINLGSTLGRTTVDGRAVYSGIKAGIAHLSEALAVEWAPDGIRVNVLAPTAVMTPSRAETLKGQFLEDMVSRIPLGRIAEAGDLARAAIYLAAPASDFITGQTLYVDGGLIAHG